MPGVLDQARLDNLDVDQLKDLVHDYGMDYDHRAMRWTDQQRPIGRIIDRVDCGTPQGSAFRDAALPEEPVTISLTRTFDHCSGPLCPELEAVACLIFFTCGIGSIQTRQIGSFRLN